MTEQERHMDELEDQIPKLAQMAFARARQAALDAGYSVLGVDGEILYEQFPDGRRLEREKVAPATPIPRGAKYLRR